MCVRAALLGGAVAASLGTACALGSESISVVETRSLPVTSAPIVPGASHAGRLFLYLFEGGRWDPDEAAAAALEAAGLLRQCSVAISKVELSVLSTPARYRDYWTPASRELLRRRPLSKPAVFFVDETLNDPAYDAEAIGRANARTRPELADTIWVAYGARDLPLALAHELVHVLSDSGEHNDTPGNLMDRATSPRATRLSDVQCDRLRHYGEANGLLRRTGD